MIGSILREVAGWLLVGATVLALGVAVFDSLNIPTTLQAMRLNPEQMNIALVSAYITAGLIIVFRIVLLTLLVVGIRKLSRWLDERKELAAA